MAHPRIEPPAGSRVLEIGSGHNPHPRSDVLCDRYLDDRERAAPLVRDRPFAQADGEELPFRDGAFGYSIAIHVAEHMRDIAGFFDELARVSSAGYVETPSAIGEHLFGWRKHRWLLTVHEGIVYVRPKQAHTPFGGLFHELMRQDAGLAAIYYRYPDLFFFACGAIGTGAFRIVW